MYSVLITLLTLLGTMEAPNSTLEVEITNIKKVDGSLRVALYKPTTEKFGTAKPDFHKVIPVGKSGKIIFKFELDPGDYAIALYHDINNNNQLDKNMVGYPKEPFGFSNNVRPVLSAPNFKDCAFKVSGASKSISITLID